MRARRGVVVFSKDALTLLALFKNRVKRIHELENQILNLIGEKKDDQKTDGSRDSTKSPTA